MSEDPLVECPSCHELQLRKVVNSVGVVFKGSGFYVTDNRNGGSKAAASSSKSETTSSTTDTSTAVANGNGDKPAADKATSNGSGDKPAKKEASTPPPAA